MRKAISAIDYLKQTDAGKVPPVCAIFGDESFLKRQCLARLQQQVLGDDEDVSSSTFSGDSAELRDVLAELSTIAMFGGKRLVVVDDADKRIARARKESVKSSAANSSKDAAEEAVSFISRNRAKLEDYVEKPVCSSVLVLVADSFPGNTKLYKGVVNSGLAIDCCRPKSESQIPAWVAKWLIDWAKDAHKLRLSKDAADLLVDIVGIEMGLLDQELDKLALLVGKDGNIGVETVSQNAGNWRTRTVWDMLDAVLEGKVAGALGQLDRLLAAGEDPVAVLAMISGSLRRLAAATRIVLQGESAGRRVSPRSALEHSGVKPFVLGKTELQLKRLGRHRGARLYRQLLKADLDLKGDSALSPRLVLEGLIVRLAAVEKG